MSALTVQSRAACIAPPFAFYEPVRDKANTVFHSVMEAIRPALKVPSSGNLNNQYQRIEQTNKRLRHIAEALPILLQKAHEQLETINAQIDAVQCGTTKIDPSGNDGAIYGLLLTVLEQTIEAALAAQQDIQAQHSAPRELKETAQLLTIVAANFAQIHNAYSDIAERIAIHDAMTEKPTAVTGIPELDSLNAA